MTIWLSGIVFLVCCVATASATEKEHCPLAKMSQAHCKKSSAVGEAFLQKTPAGAAFSCCGFLPAVFDKARKLQNNEPEVGAPLVAVAATIQPRPARLPVRHTPTYRSVVVRKNTTYLKNLTFRI